MSELRWCQRCPECEGRFAIERNVTVRETELPGRGESQRTRWSVECENAHQFVCRAARSSTPAEFQVVVG